MIEVHLSHSAIYKFFELQSKKLGERVSYYEDCIDEPNLFTRTIGKSSTLYFKSEEDYVFAVMKYSELFENHSKYQLVVKK